ncbi:class I SAM-dependent methyltransferase [Myxosarcina sp. GI1]|uniref:class I SAM-dependent methyltransferase n=1 Tax=Myxosarcina sp. GI1 TaxID=1541065 RepID=UPI000562EFB4|nr:methyltransferase domain-containing protein [Myxosarcina sp. GI1]
MKETPVREQYNQKAKVYDRRWQGYLNKTLTFLQAWVQISPHETVLDIACGTGELERLLLQQNPQQRITGVDLSEEMLKVARQKLSEYSQVSWKAASASELPLCNSCFDVVICANSFHYFEDPQGSLKEIQRVLKPNGRVIILDWCKDYWGVRILDLILKVVDRAHQQSYTQNEFHNLLTTAGFKIDRATKFRHGIVWQFMVAEATLPTKNDE